MTKKLMIQGTSSFAGKTLLVCALCRIFSEKGYRVAPFKAQNTSRNFYILKGGEEIAVAQALQAFAAGIEPTVDMNPILLKPKGDGRAQMVVRGRACRDIETSDYYGESAVEEGLDIVREALRNLEEEYDLIIIEGAGSPAEINLYHRDIANMQVAELADAPVILVADIDRGGVFASICGTLMLLEERDRERVKGIVINKFRGDMGMLEPGIGQIEELVSKPVFGVLPFVPGLDLPEEDSFVLKDTGEWLEMDQRLDEDLQRLSGVVKEKLDMDRIEQVVG